MSRLIAIISILCVVGVAFYYFWGWPIFVLRYGFSNGTELYKDCMVTKGKNLPVEFTYPESGARDVPLHSLVVVKVKDDGKHMISSGGAHYEDGTSMAPNFDTGFSSEYLTAGPIFKEGAFDIDPKFPDQFPDVDFAARNQEVDTFVRNAGYDVQKIASFRTEGSWLPNKTVIVQVSSDSCYKPYSFKFTTGTQ